MNKWIGYQEVTVGLSFLLPRGAPSAGLSRQAWELGLGHAEGMGPSRVKVIGLLSLASSTPRLSHY